MKKRILLFLAVLFIGLSVFLVKKYVLVSEKDRILRTMRSAETFLEKKDHVGFMKHLSMEYMDDYGHTWATLFFYVKSILTHYDDIKISLSQVDIEIKGDGKEKKAVVRFMAEVNAKGAAGESFSDLGRFTAEMKKDGTRWKVTWFGENPYMFY
ncbi:MAG TPA: hypothetical protein PKN36_01125 [bacterium]|nr:hypothetical protein [bacterium]